MRRLVLIVVLVAAAAAIYVALPPPARILPPAAGLAAPVRGAIHVHTNRSDGSGSMDDVAAAAGKAGLRFVIVTDHGDATRPPEPPSYRSGVLVIDAVEISTWSGHVVALGLPRAPYPLAGDGRDVIEDIARLGGFSIAAHPANDKAETRWTEWTAPFNGLEWLNGDSEWRDEPPSLLARTLVAYPFRPVESISLMLDRNDMVMSRWDELAKRRKVVAVAAADAHARVGLPSAPDPSNRRGLLHVPSYETMFRAFSIALPDASLVNDAEQDARAVVDAIRGGRVFSSVDAVAPRPAFTFTAASGSNRASAGESLALDGPVQLHVRVQAPPDAQIALFRNGTRALNVGGTQLMYEAGAEPAVYRVEVALPGPHGLAAAPWIVSNPIYVGRPPVDPPPPAFRPPAKEKADIYVDGSAGEWTVEHSTTAQAALDVARAVGGSQLLLRYALSGTPSSSPFAALVLPASSLLAQHDRVTFSVQADHPMRISMQLRVPRNGREAERWQRSVYVDTTPREVSVFFDDMTPVTRTGPRHPPLSDVGSLLFVVDTVNTKVGTSGQLFLDNVRYER